MNSLEYLYNNSRDSIIKIQLTGKRGWDNERAWSQYQVKMKLSDDEIEVLKEDYVWHHLDDLDIDFGCSMQLITKKAHSKTQPHLGSPGIINKLFGITYLN